jgi:hypothetical protein
LLFHVRDRARKAKEPVGRRRHHGRRNGPPNYFLCFFTYVIGREKQRKQLGSGAITDGETDAKTRV